MNTQQISESGDVEVGVTHLFAVLWRYRIVIVVSGLVFGLAAVWLAMTTPFVYLAEVVVTPVDHDDSGMSSLSGKFGGLASLAGINLGGAGGDTREALATLHSRALAEAFVARYKLQSSILGKGPRQSLWLAVDKFRAVNLKIRNDKENGTTIVSIQWRDPKQAAQWANNYVALANETMRTRALTEASSNIRFLNEQIAKTSVVELQRVMYGLVENQTKNQMLASTRSEYAFTVIDPAAAPEDRIWPRRSLIVLTGGVLGGLLGVFIALGHNFWRQRLRRAVM